MHSEYSRRVFTEHLCRTRPRLVCLEQRVNKRSKHHPGRRPARVLRNHSGLGERWTGNGRAGQGHQEYWGGAEYQGKGRLADREEFGLVLKEMKGSQERPSV